MKLSKKIIIPVAALTIVGAGFITANSISAQGGEQHDTLIQKIAEKFNLNQNEVEQVFNEAREEHQAQRQQEMQQRMQERLNEAVANGTITQEQKELLETKHEEMRKEREANKESWQNMEPEERREAAEQRREAMENWAEENGIDLKALMPERGEGGPKMGKGMGRGLHR